MNHARPGADIPRVRGYLRAAHAARLLVGAGALAVAINTRGEIPGGEALGIALAAVGLAWVAATALLAHPIARLLDAHPRLVLVDPAFLIALVLIDKPWDSLVALPYASFLLLVVYVSPGVLAALVVVAAVGSLAPKIVLSLAGWRHADLTPPFQTTDWVTQVAGPLIAGGITVALCTLVQGVRRASREWEAAEEALTAATVRREETRALLSLASRIHDTIAQVVRAIPLGLDGRPSDGLTPRAAEIRAEAITLSLQMRPELQRLARDARVGAQEHGPGPEVSAR